MKKTIVTVLLVFAVLSNLVACGGKSIKNAKELISKGEYEQAYELLLQSNNKEATKLLNHFYWVPVDIITNGKTYSHVYNENNLPTKAVYSEDDYCDYTYDESGRIIKTKEITYGGELVTEDTYNENGNLISQKYIYDSEIIGTAEYIYENGILMREICDIYGNKYVSEIVYNEKGQVVKRINKYENGTEEFYEYRYDERGNCVYDSSPYIDGTTQIRNYTFDQDNKLLLKAITFTDGVHMRYEYTYDQSGRVVRIDYIFGFSANVDDERSYYLYEYDQHGNVIKYTESDDGAKEEVTQITYKLVYINYDFDDGVKWTLKDYLPY